MKIDRTGSGANVIRPVGNTFVNHLYVPYASYMILKDLSTPRLYQGATRSWGLGSGWNHAENQGGDEKGQCREMHDFNLESVGFYLETGRQFSQVVVVGEMDSS